MPNTRIFLDTRSRGEGAEAPLKLAVSHRHTTALIPLDCWLSPSEWDARTCRVVRRQDALALNAMIAGRRQRVDAALVRLEMDGLADALPTARELRDRALAMADPSYRPPSAAVRHPFAERFRRFARSKKPGTRDLYERTLSRVEAYCREEGRNLERLRFEDLTREWLTGFDTFLSRTSPSRNARNIHLRNIRAAFNEAIDDGVTTFYPFRRFKIRPAATPKRSLTAEQMRSFLTFPCEPFARKWRDMFALSFYLIGINTVDLCRLKEVRDGRVEYYRAKTGRLYSVKVEPEAMEIINRYRGRGGYLLDILDRYRNYKDFTWRLDHTLKLIGPVARGRCNKKEREPMFPRLSSYWARHTWATVAAGLDIPKETIAAALGHGGNTVTDIYIDFDRSKVDRANRRVIDFVLYGK